MSPRAFSVVILTPRTSPAASVRIMTRPGTEQVARLAVPGCAAVVALTVAVLPFATAGVDPVGQPISQYATQPAGYVLVAVAAVAAAAAGLLVAALLARRDPAGARAPRVLLRLWCGALVVAAAVPTNVPGTDPGLGSLVHRGAAGAMLVLLPLAGWLLAEQARASTREASRVRAWSAVAAAFGLAFLAAHAPLLVGGPPYPLLGLLERLFVLAAAGLLLGIARLATAPSPAPARTAQVVA